MCATDGEKALSTLVNLVDGDREDVFQAIFIMGLQNFGHGYQALGMYMQGSLVTSIGEKAQERRRADEDIRLEGIEDGDRFVQRLHKIEIAKLEQATADLLVEIAV